MSSKFYFKKYSLFLFFLKNVKSLVKVPITKVLLNVIMNFLSIDLGFHVSNSKI
jgi:hypothetical protein